MKARFLLGLAAAFLVASSSALAADEIHEAAKRLGRGVNLGNSLEAPSEGAWGLTLKEEYFEAIAKAGFRHVRLPVKWSAHASDEAPYTIDPTFLARVDWAVDQALKRELKLVLNIHHFDGMDANPQASEAKLLAIWKQLGEHYSERPKGLYFELLNEPHDKLTDDRWNATIPSLLRIVRTSNPTRPVIIGGGNWNNFRNLAKLNLPSDDRNLIATFHYYEPFEFTHQGAEWAKGSEKWLGMTWTPTDEQRKKLTDDFATVAAWARSHDRPVYLGEFGCYSKSDRASRLAWTRGVADEAAKHGYSMAYWEFGSGFGVYDPKTSEWRQPLLDAILPKAEH